MTSGRAGDVDMTVGSIPRHLLTFALPLLVGYIFQQLYNTVDTWVVGKFVSKAAFAAVGTVGPVVNTLIGFFTGLAGGAGAVISQYYGAKQNDKVRASVHTSLLLTLALGILFTGVGIAMTPMMLRMMKTPENVWPESYAYLVIYFSGIIGLMLYNMCSGILRAVGNSVKPFLYLVVSALINIALDLLFVIRFGMGVRGVAYATVISQGISAILSIIELATTKSCVRLSWKALKPDWKILGQIMRIGFPSAFQVSITSFSNVFVQSYINFFGDDFMAGWTAYAKIDQVVLLPMQALALASTTFVGQNLGIHDEKRAKSGVRTAFWMSVAGTLALMIPVMIFAPQLTAFFNDSPGVVKNGTLLLRLISPFYVLCCVNQIYAGALRGSGNSLVPMLIMLGSFVAFRQIYLFTLSRIINNVYMVALAYPAGWIVASVATLIYFYRVGFTKSRIMT